MSQKLLVAGIYQKAFERARSAGQKEPERGPFGLRHQQGRVPSLISCAYWYNRQGELLGFGDLSGRDFLEIYDGLAGLEELFVVLELTAAKRVPQDVQLGSLAADLCRYVVACDGMYKVVDDAVRLSGESRIYRVDWRLKFDCVTRDEIKQRLADPRHYIR